MKNKAKTLFDHVNHIQKIQDPEYFCKLSDIDKKTFNMFMIMKVLSMNKNNIEVISIISKYLEYLTPESFYLLVINLIEKSNTFHKYIKSNVSKIPSELVECFCDKFKIGKKDAIDYFYILLDEEIALQQLLSEYGYSEKQIKKILK